jgi:hypothetical protein
MIWIELAMSSVTLYSIWLVCYGRLLVGIGLGIIMQFFWITLWVATDQVGIILLDCGIMCVYAKRMYDLGASDAR